MFAANGMACTSVPLGAQIGIDIMKNGGNAVDAAVAMAAAMPILEPTGNGMGSDCFALIWIEKEKKLYGLNASGIAPAALNGLKIRAMGHEQIPMEGWIPVLVPGAPAGWAELNKRFGSKSLREIFEPARRYALRGNPVPVNVAKLWAADSERICAASAADSEPFRGFMQFFLKKDGTPYRAGEVFRSPEYADTLTELADTNCESFYRGAVRDAIVHFSDQTGGYLSKEDFAGYAPLWVDPIEIDYKGYTVSEIPPNGHGITVLMALKILEGMDLPQEREDPESYHKMIEAIKLAFVDAKEYVADFRYMKVSADALLSDGYADERRRLISDSAMEPLYGDPSGSDTIYLCTADAEGNMVSFIQSNYKCFGSGIVVPGTGISLQNRGANFSLDPSSANYYSGGKRSYHTIIPGFLRKGDQCIGPFGVMGGFMQPQGHVQLLLNAIDYHMNPQECLDAPRFQWVGGEKILLEQAVDCSIAESLRQRGHDVTVIQDNVSMGRGQIIWRFAEGVYVGGTEPRCDGSVASF